MDRVEGGEIVPEAVAKTGLAGEFRPMLRLAWPVVLAELGWMAMSTVDTILVGRLGAEATGAVGLGNNIHIAVAIFGIGLLLGLDALVSQAHGAGDDDDARRSLGQGVWLALAITPPLMLVVLALIPGLAGFGIRTDILVLADPYLRTIVWSTGPLMVFVAFRRYLQGIGVVKPITFALITANLVNLFANYALVYGNWGFPRLGVVGSAWSTTLARVYLMAMLIGAYWLYGRGRLGSFRRPRVDWPRIRTLLALGFPAALQLTMEVGVFAASTALAGRLAASSLASHNIVLQVSSLTYMVPLGIGAAGAVRVGHAIGRGDPKAASTSGWMALLIASAFMTASGVALISLPGPIIRVFTADPSVIATTTRLFLLAAAFQLFDGVQVVATGVLRGAGDTRTPMVCNLFAHWGIGLPIGYALAFKFGYGIVGLWVGLSIGLTLAALANLMVWARKSRRLRD